MNHSSDEKKNIAVLADIKRLVDAFYGRVRQDELLAPIFNDKIGDNWPEHLEKMYRFWQTILLGEHSYYGNPFMPHSKLPIDEQHFTRWLELFYQTLDEEFEGEKAEEARWRAGKMAEMFQFKLQYYREKDSTALK
ncbi:MAG: group III truncated hemoglobin [Fulvivirga sp.]